MRSLAEVAHAHDVPLVVDEAWGAHLAFHEELPEHALAAGADLVISSTHKIVGSLTQSAMLHLGSDRIGEDIVDRTVTLTESTSPNSLLIASLDAARRLAAVSGHDLIAETARAVEPGARRDQARSPASTCSTSASSGAAASTATTRCGSPSTCAASRSTATSSRRGCASARTSTSSWPASTWSSACSAWAVRPSRSPSASSRRCAWSRPRRGLAEEGAKVRFAPAPPWGELVMTPREAFLGAQEVVPAAQAVDRIAAESLATYPPGIPNVLPGERLTAETLAYIQRTLELGGSVRGASDRLLHTVRVVAARG